MASKSKKRRRVFRASCILAALIIAGSSFAWFTSSDEVTNRLSASADYGAKIVESFAPPKHWLPGEEVNKDVYTVNTGTIPTYVGMDISGALSIVREETIAIPAGTTTTTTKTYTVTYTDGESVEHKLTLSESEYAEYVKDDSGLKYYPNKVTNDSVKYDATVTENTTTTTTDAVFDCIELTDDERYAVEAGAYLAYKPDGDTMNNVGDQVVNYNGATTTTYVYTVYKDTSSTQLVTTDTKLVAGDFSDNTSGEGYNATAAGANYNKKATIGGTVYYFKEDATTPTELTSNGTDFTPRADGLYVFRRSIDVDAAGFGDSGVGKGAETFTYDGYYYYGGRYYKIADLSVTPDTVNDIAGDTDKRDGQLTNATAKLVREVKDYRNPVDLEYDNANHRLIATYNMAESDATLDAALQNAAATLDKAEHDYADAELELRRAILDAASEDTAVKTATATRDDAQRTRDQKKAAYDAAKAKYEALKKAYTDAKAKFDVAQAAVESDIADLVGGSGSSATIAISNATGTLVSRATTSDSVTADTKADEYKKAKKAYDDFVADHTVNSTENPADSIEHIYFTYLQELDAKGVGYTMSDGINAGSSTAVLENEIKKAVAAVEYDDLVALDFADNNDLHTYHQKLVAYKLAEEKYEEALQKYVDDVATLNNIIAILNQSGTGNDIASVNTTTATSYDNIHGIDPKAGNLYNALNTARTAYDGGNADPVDGALGNGGAIGELASAEAELLAAETALQDATNNVDGNDDVEGNLEAAWTKYYKAKNAMYSAEKALEDAQEKHDKNADFKIYIYLDNDVLVGGVADKWQILPTTVGADNTAHFYYTSILQGGEVSSKLVDKVVLDKNITQDMYKYFDFDVNVAMKSAQITYAADGTTITAEATPSHVGATATLETPTSVDTVVTWSANS